MYACVFVSDGREEWETVAKCWKECKREISIRGPLKLKLSN